MLQPCLLRGNLTLNAVENNNYSKVKEQLPECL